MTTASAVAVACYGGVEHSRNRKPRSPFPCPALCNLCARIKGLAPCAGMPSGFRALRYLSPACQGRQFFMCRTQLGGITVRMRGGLPPEVASHTRTHTRTHAHTRARTRTHTYTHAHTHMPCPTHNCPIHMPLKQRARRACKQKACAWGSSSPAPGTGRRHVSSQAVVWLMHLQLLVSWPMHLCLTGRTCLVDVHVRPVGVHLSPEGVHVYHGCV